MREKILFAFLMSGSMAFIMSGAMMYLALGFDENFFNEWMHTFPIAFSIAFPCVLILAPLIRKIMGLRKMQ